MVPVFGVPLESEGIDLGPLLPHHLSEIVVGIVLLLVIFVVMWKLVVPKFEELYDQRTDAIEGGMERAQRA
ncbi:MAG: F0F1 ATP synthase subunit B, partial [Propionibacterium sp.]